MPRLPVVVVVALLWMSCCCYCNADSIGDCDPYLESWQLCNAMAICRERLFIDINGDDLTAYRELIHQHPANELEMLTHLFCNSTAHSQESRELWALLMAHTDYCPDKNEFYVSGSGCVCRDNKICEYNASRNIFFPVANTWVIGVLTALTLGLAGLALHKLNIFREWMPSVIDEH